MYKHPILFSFCVSIIFQSIMFQSVSASTVDSHYFLNYGSLHPANTFADHPIINSNQGITQLAIDLSGATNSSLLSVSDFSFRVGNSSDPASWEVLTTAPVIQVATGAGIGGSDRITFDWSIGTIVDTWIEVTTESSANSGLAAPDYFYAGSMIGDVNGDLQRTAADSLLIINSLNVLGSPHPATTNDPLDVNRDGLISPLDTLLVINLLNNPTGATQLKAFTPRESFYQNPNPNPNPVPLPQSIWLVVSGIVALSSVARNQEMKRVKP